MLYLPIWLWLLLIAAAAIAWLTYQTYHAGTRTMQRVAASSARARGLTAPVSQAAHAETCRALAAYEDTAPDALVVQFVTAPNSASLNGQRLAGPLLLMATGTTLGLRSRVGNSKVTYTFLRHRDLQAHSANGNQCRLATSKGAVLDLQLDHQADTARLTAWAAGPGHR